MVSSSFVNDVASVRTAGTGRSREWPYDSREQGKNPVQKNEGTGIFGRRAHQSGLRSEPLRGDGQTPRPSAAHAFTFIGIFASGNLASRRRSTIVVEDRRSLSESAAFSFS